MYSEIQLKTVLRNHTVGDWNEIINKSFNIN